MRNTRGFAIVPLLVLLVLASVLVLVVLKTQQPAIDNSQATALVLSPLPTASPSPTPSPTPSPSPTPVPTIKPSPTVKPTASPAPISTGPLGSGFSVRHVQTANGVFTVYLIGADLNSTKVIVDTASASDCANNCPVLPLKDYVTRNSAYAGINGGYFCPDTYPTCAGKTNSFDTLLMNKDKTYFNSSNNVYSTVPAVIFQGSSVRFVSASQEWGRDTSVDSVIANYPLLVFNSNIAFSGSSDPKINSKSSRGFVANQGSMIFIGMVLNSTMADSAATMKAMGMQNALNLDDGGSAALWSGGYKIGPGRNLPNVILFKTK